MSCLQGSVDKCRMISVNSFLTWLVMLISRVQSRGRFSHVCLEDSRVNFQSALDFSRLSSAVYKLVLQQAPEDKLSLKT